MLNWTFHIESIWLVLLVALSVSLNLNAQEIIPSAFNNHSRQVADNLDDCMLNLSASHKETDGGLNSESIQLVSWNVKKGSDPAWIEDLEKYARSVSLITLQEAMLGQSSATNSFRTFFWSFADGYRRGKKLSGVATYSQSQPLTQCNLKLIEPWLRTPKATSITQYALTGTHKKLLVINLHAINYTIGLSAFRKQLVQIANILNIHDGPVIFTGDFNTWSERRKNELDKLTRRADLRVVFYPEDHRVTFFGHVVDYIYYRELTLVESRSHRVYSSDHNPIFAEFAL